MSRQTAQWMVTGVDGDVAPSNFLPAARPARRGHDMHDPVTVAIEAFARGEIVVVTDDDDRENEGDLIVAASLCTMEKMAFIIRNGCGIVCAPLTADDARRLHLPPMVATNEAPLGTAFTVSVDVKHGLTTGISAEQRCNTVRALANGNMGASDFVRPATFFRWSPRNGILMRSGHTEAAVDLCQLSGLPPIAVICELANDDGTVMVGPQIRGLRRQAQAEQISVADLIAYRQARRSWSSALRPSRSGRPSANCRAMAIGRPSIRFCISLSCMDPSATAGTCRRGCTGATSSATFSGPARSRRSSSVSRPKVAARWSICAMARREFRPILPVPTV